MIPIKLSACRSCGVMFAKEAPGSRPICGRCENDENWSCEDCGTAINDDALHLLNGSIVCPLPTK